MFVDLKDLRFFVDTGKLWEPFHLSSSDNTMHGMLQLSHDTGVCVHTCVYTTCGCHVDNGHILALVIILKLMIGVLGVTIFANIFCLFWMLGIDLMD
jgi:hypothetical protein